MRNRTAPPVQNHGSRIKLQQDNACHIAKVVQNELQVWKINNLPWPAIFPDLSPTEYIWDKVKHLQQQQVHPP